MLYNTIASVSVFVKQYADTYVALLKQKESKLLSTVTVSKYADYLPWYRQRLIFLRAGVDLSKSTPCDWIGHCGIKLKHLTDTLKKAV